MPRLNLYTWDCHHLVGTSRPAYALFLPAAVGLALARLLSFLSTWPHDFFDGLGLFISGLRFKNKQTMVDRYFNFGQHSKQAMIYN